MAPTKPLEPMLLRLQSTLQEQDLQAILTLCQELGYTTRFLDEAKELLQLEGIQAPNHRSRLTDLTGVVGILKDPSPGERVYSQPGEAEQCVVPVAEARFGAGNISLIAGPCAVEDRDRLIEIAVSVKRSGATLLRGGAFKPRTSPYSFQGLGQVGLDYLAEAKAEAGIGIVSEILDVRHVSQLELVVDMFQVGARNMANYELLKELGKTRTPVLLKRGFGATVSEWLGAAEYLLAGGNESVVLCERGVRGFDTVTRHMLDIGAVAYLKTQTHLPVIVDPSHAAGRADLVRPLAKAGLAAGADGLMIEVHPRPAELHSDGAQAISLSLFDQIALEAQALAQLEGRRVVLPQAGEGSTDAPIDSHNNLNTGKHSPA